MLSTLPAFATLADSDLLATVKRLARRERDATAALAASLVELDARRLYLGEGSSSLFVYCTRVLRLSEHAAYHRITAARAGRRFPTILERLADGSLTLTNITLLAPHLTPANHVAVLDTARHKSKREVEQQVATLSPRPDVPTSIRKQPPPRPASSAPSVASPAAAGADERTPGPTVPPDLLAAASTSSRAVTGSAGEGSDGGESPRSAATDLHVPPPRQRAVIEPLAPARYKVQITLDADTVEKLRRAQDLLRHTIPDGNPAAVLDRALTVLLEQLERRQLAATVRPRASRAARQRSRYVPAAVRRAVWARDEGRCTFVGAEGRCGETAFLELHHLEPYALGGETTVAGLALRCAAHNRYEAEREFGVPVEIDGGQRTASTRTGPAAARGDCTPTQALSPVVGNDSPEWRAEASAREPRGTPPLLLRERRPAYGAPARSVPGAVLRNSARTEFRSCANMRDRWSWTRRQWRKRTKMRPALSRSFSTRWYSRRMCAWSRKRSTRFFSCPLPLPGMISTSGIRRSTACCTIRFKATSISAPRL